MLLMLDTRDQAYHDGILSRSRPIEWVRLMLFGWQAHTDSCPCEMHHQAKSRCIGREFGRLDALHPARRELCVDSGP